jgi:hypothetical protein
MTAEEPQVPVQGTKDNLGHTMVKLPPTDGSRWILEGLEWRLPHRGQMVAGKRCLREVV